MADGYARFTGHQAVATSHAGPTTLTNAATSLAVAQRHPSPVLLLAGDAPLGDLHNPQGFQQAALAAALTRRGRHAVGVGAVAEQNARHRIATTGPGRPFVLNLPTDVEWRGKSERRLVLPAKRHGRARWRPDRRAWTWRRRCCWMPCSRRCWQAVSRGQRCRWELAGLPGCSARHC